MTRMINKRQPPTCPTHRATDQLKRIRRGAIAGFALWLAGLAGPALGATPATLVGPDLQARAVNVQSLGDGVLSYFDTDRHYKTESIDQLVQIRDIGVAATVPAADRSGGVPGGSPRSGSNAAPGTGAPAAPATLGAGVEPPPAAGTTVEGAASVELIDGQRLTGKWVSALPDGQRFQWQHALVGTVTINLDSVRALSLRARAPTLTAGGAPASGSGGSPAPPAPDAAANASGSAPAGDAGQVGDRVELVNGDVMSGFVTGIDGASVQLKPADKAEPVVLPLDRVRALRLANAPRTPKPGQHLVWLEDGSRILSSALSIGDESLRIQATLSAASVGMPLKAVRRIDLSSKAGRLTPLTEATRTLSGGGEVFGVPTPPRADPAGLRLHAPVTVSFELPLGASRLAAEALLDTDSESVEVKRWADMDLILRCDDREIGRFHIDGAHPAAGINLPVSGRMLSLELSPAANGPVMDRLVLRDAVLLVRPPSARP